MAVGKHISFRLTLPLFGHLRFREVCWPWKRIQNKSHHPTHQKPEPEHFQEILLSTAPSCTRSSETEIVDTCEELMEIALLFTNETGLLDVKEVRLSFHRQSWAPTIESGMPTLRRFIRPTDWDRIETMIQNVINLPPSEIERRCYFRHPMLFRVPGASRSYMCSRQTYITLHCPQVMDDPERPIFFRMHLSLVGGLRFFIFHI